MRSSAIPLIALGIFLATPEATAQRQRSLPSGYTWVEGGNNNTIPFWAASGVYQQAHDDVDMMDMNGGGAVIMLGLGFRKDGSLSGTTQARTMDVQITVGISTVSSQTATNDFASNLGPNPTVVLQYTQVNIPALSNVSLPNPTGYVIPFTAPFPFPPVPGNHFVWEMRHRNNSNTVSMPMDAVAGAATVVYVTQRGLGCQVPGQPGPAQISAKSWDITSGDYRNQLSQGPANSAAIFLLGTEPNQIRLPGFCTSFEFVPQVTLAGTTNGAGSWDLLIQPGINFTGYPAITLAGQFLFFDQGLPQGVGLSDASVMTLPSQSGTRVARIYNAPSQGGPGNETATTATSVGRNYGLVTLFQIP